MSRIRIDIDTLRTYSNNLQNRINDYEVLNERFNTLSLSIKSDWQGNAAEAFGELSSQYVSRAKSLTEILIQFKNYAQETADKFDAVDTDCANRIRGSF